MPGYHLTLTLTPTLTLKTNRNGLLAEFEAKLRVIYKGNFEIVHRGRPAGAVHLVSMTLLNRGKNISNPMEDTLR